MAPRSLHLSSPPVLPLAPVSFPFTLYLIMLLSVHDTIVEQTAFIEGVDTGKGKGELTFTLSFMYLLSVPSFICKT